MALAGAAAAHPPALSGDLALDADAPFIAARFAGQMLKLRVDPGEWGVVSLNPATAARLGLRWEPAGSIEVGRTVLQGRRAVAPLVIDGRARAVFATDFGRDAAADADGAIGPDLLPYLTVRWLRPAAPPAGEARLLPLRFDPAAGLEATPPGLPAHFALRFTLMQPVSTATAAAASVLVADHGGRFEGEAHEMALLYGQPRPVRSLRFDRPPVIAGFRFETLAVRIDDFRGHNPLPADPVAPDEIVVSAYVPPQHGVAWLTLAADRLSRCAEIVYSANPRSLRLACAFDR